MKIHVRIRWLLILLLGMWILILWINWYYSRSKLNMILENREQELQNLTGKILDLRGKSMYSFCYDYTFWDDMVEFVKTGDADWAKENIEVSMDTFDTQAAWVYRPDFGLVYFRTTFSDSTFQDLPQYKSALEKLFAQSPLIHFFIPTSLGIMEIRGATVHPTSDPERKTPSQGLFFVGRVWDPDYLQELSDLFGGQVNILDGIHSESTTLREIDKKGHLELYHPILDVNHRPFKTLKVDIFSPEVNQFIKDTNNSLTVGAMLSLLFFTLITGFLLKWISNPLRLISASLDTEDDKPISQLQKDRTEFGYISRLIRQSFHHKQELITEINQRKQVEVKLKQSEDQMRALAAHLQGVREEERSRIARELYDELGQTLTGLRIDLDWVEKQFAKVNGTNPRVVVTDKIKSMSRIIDNSIQELGRIATELRPGILDDLGLEAALEWEIRQFEIRTGMECELHWESCNAIHTEYCVLLFRILQEILANIARHSHATQVQINLKTVGNDLQFEVKDNGIGISESDVFSSQSLGFLGIKERAHQYGGEVSIIGIPGSGTTVQVRLPTKSKE